MINEIIKNIFKKFIMFLWNPAFNTRLRIADERVIFFTTKRGFFKRRSFPRGIRGAEAAVVAAQRVSPQGEAVFTGAGGPNLSPLQQKVFVQQRFEL